MGLKQRLAKLEALPLTAQEIAGVIQTGKAPSERLQKWLDRYRELMQQMESSIPTFQDLSPEQQYRYNAVSFPHAAAYIEPGKEILEARTREPAPTAKQQAPAEPGRVQRG